LTLTLASLKFCKLIRIRVNFCILRCFRVDVFSPHAPKFGFFLDKQRFIQAMSSREPSAVTLALRNAVYLWGIRLSRQQDIIAHEGIFVQRSLTNIQNAVSVLDRQPDGVPYVLQAEVLLAYYFFDSNRVNDGQFHTTGAVTIARNYRYHKIFSGQRASGPFTPEIKEKIKAWWQVFILEKSWASALGVPSMLIENDNLTTIETPWPGNEVSFSRPSFSWLI
jgi:hypothetical protein